MKCQTLFTWSYNKKIYLVEFFSAVITTVLIFCFILIVISCFIVIVIPDLFNTTCYVKILAENILKYFSVFFFFVLFFPENRL